MNSSLAQQRVTIIGGTGFIGSHLAEFLVGQDAVVTVVARSLCRIDNLNGIQGRFDFEICDISDRRSISAVMKKVRPEVVFHLAADPDGAENFDQMIGCIQHNTIGTANVLAAAAGAGVQLLIYADSAKDFGNGPVPYREGQPDDPICSYAIGKSAGWKLCCLVSDLTGLAVCALRPTFVYGPRQNWNLISFVAECVQKGTPVHLQGGSQTRDLLYVDDVVRAFAAAAIRKQAWGHAIPLGGGREVTVQSLCHEILKVVESGIAVFPDSEKLRSTEIWRSYCDNVEAKELLGWLPQVGLSEGLGYTVGQMRVPREKEKVFTAELLS